MLSKDCGQCKYCVWMVGIGFGVRCNHPDNQKYKEDYPDDMTHLKMPVVISYVPETCSFKNILKFKEK